VKQFENGQHETGRFTRPGFGNTQHVAPGQNDRNGLLLNGVWFAVLLIGHGPQQRFGQTEG